MAQANDKDTSKPLLSTSVWRSVLKAAGFKQSLVPAVDFQFFGNPQSAKDDKASLLAFLVGAIKHDTIQPFTTLKALPKASLQDLLNTQDQNGADLLTIACLWSRKQVVEYLIDELHADVQTPIAFATNYHEDVVNYVKRNDKCISIMLQDGLLEFLLRKGAKLNALCNKTTLLLESFQHLDMTQVKQLIKLCADPEVADADGNTLLMKAVSIESASKLVNYLIRVLKVDVNKANQDLDTALHLAVKSKNIKVVGLLLQYGAKLTLNDFKLTPPMIAAIENLTEIVELFLSYNVSTGQSLLTQQEKADLIELLGCSITLLYEYNNVNWNSNNDENCRKTVTMWLRAERLRKQAGLPTPDYESSCAALISTLSKVVPDLLPIQLLQPEDNDESDSARNSDTPFVDSKQSAVACQDDDAVVENVLKRQTYRLILAHLLIRQQRILGVEHLSNFYFVVYFMRCAAYLKWHHIANYLLTFALHCKTSVSAPFLSKQPLYGCYQVVLLIRSVLKMMPEENPAVNPSDLLELLELSADYLDCLQTDLVGNSSSFDAKQSFYAQLSVSVLLCGAGTMLCTIIDSFTRVFSQPEFNTDFKTEAADVRLFKRLEQVVRRICNRKLRGLRGGSLLHYAVFSNSGKSGTYFQRWIESYDSYNHLQKSFEKDFMLFTPAEFCFFTKPDGEVLDLLVRAGADCNARDDDGNTPLHIIALDMASMMKRHLNSLVFQNRMSVCQCATGSQANYSLTKVRVAWTRGILKCVLARAFSTRNRDVDSSQMQSAALQMLFQADNQPDSEFNGVDQQTMQNSNACLEYFDSFYESKSYCSTCGEQFGWYLEYAPLAATFRALVPFTHTCARNKDGKTYLDILDEVGTTLGQAFNFSSEFRNNQMVALQCLCARSVRSLLVNYESVLPSKLAEFVSFH